MGHRTALRCELGSDGATQGKERGASKLHQSIVCYGAYPVVKLLFHFLPSFLSSAGCWSAPAAGDPPRTEDATTQPRSRRSGTEGTERTHKEGGNQETRVDGAGEMAPLSALAAGLLSVGSAGGSSAASAVRAEAAGEHRQTCVGD
jgi:hypothetical protein